MRKIKVNEVESLPCYGNEGIACANTSDCNHCGWNPAVAAERLEKIKKGLQKVK